MMLISLNAYIPDELLFHPKDKQIFIHNLVNPFLVASDFDDIRSVL
jgi:hypothetical protein